MSTTDNTSDLAPLSRTREEIWATYDALCLLLEGAAAAVFHAADYAVMFGPLGRDVFTIETDHERLAQGVMGVLHGTEIRLSRGDVPPRRVRLIWGGAEEQVALFPEAVVHPTFLSWAQALRAAHDAGAHLVKYNNAKARLIGIRAWDQAHYVPLTKCKDVQVLPDSPITDEQMKEYTKSWDIGALFR